MLTEIRLNESSPELTAKHSMLVVRDNAHCSGSATYSNVLQQECAQFRVDQLGLSPWSVSARACWPLWDAHFDTHGHGDVHFDTECTGRHPAAHAGPYDNARAQSWQTNVMVLKLPKTTGIQIFISFHFAQFQVAKFGLSAHNLGIAPVDT